MDIVDLRVIVRLEVNEREHCEGADQEEHYDRDLRYRYGQQDPMRELEEGFYYWEN